jgi:hypothetical protein
MEDSTDTSKQSISWWITSLAISVTCCAVLFVIFAGYLSDIKKELSSENAQLEQMAVHEDRLLAEIQTLQRSVTSGQTPPLPTAVPTVVVAPPPTSSPEPTSTTVETPMMAPVGTSMAAPVGTTAPTVVTPPSVSPTAIPEVPAKK